MGVMGEGRRLQVALPSIGTVSYKCRGRKGIIEVMAEGQGGYMFHFHSRYSVLISGFNISYDLYRLLQNSVSLWFVCKERLRYILPMFSPL